MGEMDHYRIPDLTCQKTWTDFFAGVKNMFWIYEQKEEKCVCVWTHLVR